MSINRIAELLMKLKKSVYYRNYLQYHNIFFVTIDVIEKFTLKARIVPITEDIKIYVAISMGCKIIGAITRKNIECEFIEKKLIINSLV